MPATTAPTAANEHVAIRKVAGDTLPQNKWPSNTAIDNDTKAKEYVSETAERVATNSVSRGTNRIENAWIEPSTVDTIAAAKRTFEL